MNLRKSESKNLIPFHKSNLLRKKTLAIGQEIEILLTKNVINPSSHEDGEFISTNFVTTKRVGRLLTLNLKYLNKNIEHVHFKMHGLKEIPKLIRPGCMIASLHAKVAYY